MVMMDRRTIQWILFVATALLATWSCQQSTQPNDLTVSRNVTVRILLDDGTPVADARVDWEKLSGPSSPVGGSVRSTTSGNTQIVIPNVSVTRDLVAFRVTLPTSYAGIDPITWQDSICTDTMYTIVVRPTIPCGTTSVADTILLECCPASGDRTIADCRYYPTACAPGLVFSSLPIAAQDVSLDLATTGTTASMLNACVTYAPAVGAPSGSQTSVTTTITGTAPGSQVAQIRIALTIIGRVNCDQCACPTTQNVSTDLGRICVGSTTDTTIDCSSLMLPLALDNGCIAEFDLESNTVADLTMDGNGDFAVRGGESFPDLGVTITPRKSGPVSGTLRYKVSVRNTRTGTVQVCPEPVQIDISYQAIIGACAVTGFPLDTLEKCVFTDQQPEDQCTIVNNGDCPITVTVTSQNPLFTTSPSGVIVVPARGRIDVTVRFSVVKQQWDNNPMTPRGTRGDKDFSGEILIEGCGDQPQRFTVNGIGYVQCDAFKYQCLRQFRPTGYENVYAESIELVDQKTIITYQNDNQTFKVFDIYVQQIESGGNVTLATGINPSNGRAYGGFVKVTSGFSVLPGQNICDTYPAAAAQRCSDIKSGAVAAQQTLTGLRQGDVVLFVKTGASGPQCALIWIQSVGPDRPGAVSLDQVCIEICYPVFTL